MITYQTKNTHPGTLPSATIYMGGLLCLSFDQANRCTVGVNNLVGGGHTWKFSVVDQETGKPILVRNQGKLQDLHEIHIDVKGDTRRGVYVYNGKGRVSLPTRNEHRFNLESSWIDLEGPRGHNKPVENNTNTLWPRFYINHGLFCASKLSTGSFAFRDSKRTPVIKPLGKVALEVVADIFLDSSNPRSEIEVKLPDQTVSLDNTKRYQIYITNDCGSLAPVQTDFPLHYKAFSGAFDGSPGKMNAEDKFQMVHDNASAKGEAESIVAQAGDDYDDLTDKAPCMTIALGQTSNFKA